MHVPPSPSRLIPDHKTAAAGRELLKTDVFSADNDKTSQLLSNAPHQKKDNHDPFAYSLSPINRKDIKRDALTSIHISAYAVGHLSNDLCAAAWFTYVLFYI
jgi:hypothetical protein